MYIFYYMPGTFHQYLAARELKRQAWRFHKNYLTWFQRYTEPTVNTETYERGTYWYFDYVLREGYDGGWQQKMKEDFLFNYEFLEDELPSR